MATSNLDKLMLREQAKIIQELKTEIESLQKSTGASVVQLFDVLNDSPPDLSVNIDDFLSDNSTFNFRLNAALKKEFAELCKRHHLTVGSALKRYMTDCVRSRSLR